MKQKIFNCGLDATLSIISGRWKFLILYHLFSENRRFGELKRRVAGVSEKMLAQGLKELEKDGIVRRKDFREVPPRVEYSLTPRGKNLSGLLPPLREWGERNLASRIMTPSLNRLYRPHRKRLKSPAT